MSELAAARQVLKDAGREIKAGERVAYLARKLCVTPRTVRNWCLLERIKAERMPSGRWRIPSSEVQRLMSK